MGGETSVCGSTYLCIHWLIVVCVLIDDRTHNLGVLEHRCNQLGYPASQGQSWPFLFCLWLLSVCSAHWSHSNRDVVAVKSRMFTIWPFREKKIVDSWSSLTLLQFQHEIARELIENHQSFWGGAQESEGW